jgi:uncharacterized metal-binding protein
MNKEEMPSFKFHKWFNYIFLIILPFLFLIVSLGVSLLMLFYAIGIYVGTNWITPDLDIISTPTNKHGIIWKLFWTPYRWTHKHQGVSHTLMGSLERILYISPLFLIIFILTGWNKLILINNAGMIFGIIVANATHITLDRIVRSIRI